jgi:N-methylhydantoinase A/oxoprolinase/acetone carboxylase beta subunit
MVETPVYDREVVNPDQSVSGPAIFAGSGSTVVCPPDWEPTILPDGTIQLEVAT